MHRIIGRLLVGFSLVLSGCGARTSFFDPADYPDGYLLTDAADTPDGFTPPGDRPGTDLTPGCLPPLALCNGACVDLRTSVVHCGGCGRTCLGGLRCVNSVCQTNCSSPLQVCGAACIDPRSDARNCGFCNNICAPGLRCVNRSCVSSCTGGQALCSGVCVTVSLDPSHCGGCGIRCGGGQACIGGRCSAVAPLSYPEFRVDSYGATNCRAAEHSAVTGDDRGGIALSTSGVLYTGDTSTGLFDPEGLSGRPIGRVMQAMLSDLRTEQVYSLALAGVAITSPSRVDTLIQLDPSTGASLRTLRLSTPIELTGSSAVGFFSGYGRLVIHSASQVYDINPGTGVVTPLGVLGIGTHTICETWGFWGVAETLRGELWMDYVENGTTIIRRNARTGETQTVARFSTLSDMCSFTVSPARRRWYFHHEGTSQFRSGDETLGFCDASVSAFTSSGYTQSLPPAEVRWIDACGQPAAQRVLSRTDDNAVASRLPFGFRYWGETLAAGTSVNVTSNGWIGLDIPMNAALGGTIPAMELPNNVIAPYWGDNFTRDPGVCVATVGSAPNRSYVVEWNDSYHCCMDDPGVHLSYELILNETQNTIDFLYNDMRGARQQTVGLENSSGTEAAVVCNAGTMCAVIATGTRIRFTPTR